VTRDLGQMGGVRTPFIDGVLGLARLKATKSRPTREDCRAGRVAFPSRSSSLRLISSCD
jgi:hypothetical protein